MDFASRELDELARKRLLRNMRVISSIRGSRVTMDGREYVSFASNDYLGLSQHPALREAVCRALEEDGFFGAGASRLISGTTTRHVELERAIAEFKRAEAALVFTSGYAANLGVITSLADSNCFIAADEFNHASLIDACRLSRATVHIYQHCDYREASKALCQARGYRRRLLVTDTVFSMDGDVAPLPAAIDCAKRNDAMLVIDDAHGTGVLGAGGRGAAEHFGVEKQIDVLIGTLSKALGCVGGFVCGKAEMIRLTANRSRTFMYTTALPPAFCAAAEKAIELAQGPAELRKRLWANAERFRTAVAHRLPRTRVEAEPSSTEPGSEGAECEADANRPGDSEAGGGKTGVALSPIVPVVVGDEKRVMEVFEGLMADGIFAPAIRPPTVPVGTCRLRISISALHTDSDIDALLASLRKHGAT